MKDIKEYKSSNSTKPLVDWVNEAKKRLAELKILRNKIEHQNEIKRNTGI